MRWFVAAVLAVSVAVAIYLGSALVSLSGLVEAARAGDAPGVLSRTDIDRLRHSLVEQIVAGYLAQLGRDRPVKPLERMLATTYGSTVADALIAKLLTPENLTKLLSNGVIGSEDGAAIADLQRLSDIDTSKKLDLLRRMSLVKPVELQVDLGETAEAGAINIRFEGSGWKLSGIQLPGAVVQKLAESLINGRERKG